MKNDKTLTILGYKEIIESVKLRTSSSLGKKLAEEMIPSVEPHIVLERYEEVKEAVKIINEGTGLGLGGINDITPFIKKIEKGAFLQPEELIKVSDFLRSIRNLKKSIKRYEFIAPVLFSYSTSLGLFKTIENDIEYCIGNGIVRSRASSTLGKIRRKIESLQSKRIDKLNKFLSANKNSKYLQENYYSQRDNRYVVPIKTSSRKFVDGTIIDSSASGSTVYIEIDSIKDLTVEIIMLKAQETEECNQILRRLSEVINERIDEIWNAIHILGKYDFIMAKGKYSVSIGGNEIEIRDDETINLVKARHPMLGKDAVPLNVQIGTDYRTLIITGPNTGGKTITLKTVGLMVLLTQSGILPPVGKGSNISIFRQILVDIGDSQSIEQSLSTFSGHMKNLVEIIKKSQRRTLVLIDEIGTGTDPKDGAALGIAILEEIYNKGAITLSSTHYSKIKEYSEIHEGFINASMDFDRVTLKPLFRLIVGIAGNSNALWISKELGLADKIIERVNRINSTHEIIAARKISKFSKKKSRVEELRKEKEVIDTERVFYEKGDRVIVNETKNHSLIFEHNVKEKKVMLFRDGKYEEVNEKRVTLDNRAEVLYPVGYNLDQLFKSFKSRKLEKDISKGRFKNLKELNERLNSIN
ncbi:endonuclease MutS2 [Clostridiaceae bacterium HSG29]|nr:endonuclease MutS2 [Clostridiaceae bacterium HSG29]